MNGFSLLTYSLILQLPNNITKNVSCQLRPNIPSHNDEITDDVQTQEQKQT